MVFWTVVFWTGFPPEAGAERVRRFDEQRGVLAAPGSGHGAER
jgi:hypothetical protein